MSIMKKTPVLLLAGFAAMMSCFVACNKNDTPVQPVVLTLYDSLGGTTLVTDPTNPSMKIEQGRLGIRSVVDSTIFVIAADTAINSYFTVLLSEVTVGNLSGFQDLSNELTNFFCVATGAKNFMYTGLNMVDAHDPGKNSRMNGKAGNDDFDAFVADLVAGAQQNALPDYLIARVGALVETLRTQVVQN
jgi:hypothetical protein